MKTFSHLDAAQTQSQLSQISFRAGCDKASAQAWDAAMEQFEIALFNGELTRDADGDTIQSLRREQADERNDGLLGVKNFLMQRFL
jgi:hypothetical protein